MGVLLRTTNDGVRYYSSGNWTTKLETEEEVGLHALVNVWQGGDATVHDIAASQFADNKFGFPVEWFRDQIAALSVLAAQIKASADAAVAAANAAANAANAAGTSAAGAKTSADAAKVAAEAAATKGQAQAILVAIGNIPGGGGGGLTVEQLETSLAKQKVILGNVVVDPQ